MVGKVGFPKLYYYVKDKTSNIMVMSLFDKNLSDLFEKHSNKFPLKTIILIAF